MLTDHFPECRKIKDRLYDILEQEFAKRRKIGLANPKDVDINLLIGDRSKPGSSSIEKGTPTISLNILFEVPEHSQIESWIQQAGPLVEPSRYIPDSRLTQILLDPDTLKREDVGEAFGPYFDVVWPTLKQDAGKIAGYVHRIILELKDRFLLKLSAMLRHELEHLNPDYQKEHDLLRQREAEYNAIFMRYLDGEKPFTTTQLKRKFSVYFGLASTFLPEDEVRAFYYPNFDPDKDTEETLYTRKLAIEQHMSEEYMPLYRDEIMKAVIWLEFMTTKNQNKEPDEKTLRYVQSVFTPDESVDQNPNYTLDQVDFGLADKLYRMIGFWENKYREGLKLALARVHSFYVGKLNANKTESK